MPVFSPFFVACDAELLGDDDPHAASTDATATAAATQSSDLFMR
jgi:hypothetical protein